MTSLCPYRDNVHECKFDITHCKLCLTGQLVDAITARNNTRNISLCAADIARNNKN